MLDAHAYRGQQVSKDSSQLCDWILTWQKKRVKEFWWEQEIKGNIVKVKKGKGGKLTRKLIKGKGKKESRGIKDE